VKSLFGFGQVRGEDCCCRSRAVLYAGTTRSTSLPVIRHAWCQATDQVRRSAEATNRRRSAKGISSQMRRGRWDESFTRQDTRPAPDGR
jgi:hypothetical protein